MVWKITNKQFKNKTATIEILNLPYSPKTGANKNGISTHDITPHRSE
jgi:hypothetical protein